MPENKLLRTSINILIYTISFFVMTYMLELLFSRFAGFENIGKMCVSIALLLLTFIAFSILDFRNKIFEAKTIWGKNLRLIFFFNIFLVIGLWVFTFIKVIMADFSLQNGLWYASYDKYHGLVYDHLYFHPILGTIGLIISTITFCNVKYRINKADYRKTIIELLPIIAVGILIFCHYYCIEKPYFKG